MKQYGFNVATEFSKKQINVLYAKNRSGELTISKDMFKDLYYLADYYGMDQTIADREQRILYILKYMFAGNFEEAQKEIDGYERFFIRHEKPENIVKYEVNFHHDTKKYGKKVDYMISVFRFDGESVKLYAERTPADDEKANYEDLKADILDQADMYDLCESDFVWA